METNWLIITIVAVFAIVLVIFVIKRNVKDEKDLETFLNKNEYQIKKEESDVNDED